MTSLFVVMIRQVPGTARQRMGTGTVVLTFFAPHLSTALSDQQGRSRDTQVPGTAGVQRSIALCRYDWAEKSNAERWDPGDSILRWQTKMTDTQVPGTAGRRIGTGTAVLTFLAPHLSTALTDQQSRSRAKFESLFNLPYSKRNFILQTQSPLRPQRGFAHIPMPSTAS